MLAHFSSKLSYKQTQIWGRHNRQCAFKVTSFLSGYSCYSRKGNSAVPWFSFNSLFHALNETGGLEYKVYDHIILSLQTHKGEKFCNLGETTLKTITPGKLVSQPNKFSFAICIIFTRFLTVLHFFGNETLCRGCEIW